MLYCIRFQGLALNRARPLSNSRGRVRTQYTVYMKNFEHFGGTGGVPERADSHPEIHKKVSGKELSSERHMDSSERLGSMLEKISEEINLSVAELYGMEKLVNSDCSINMNEYDRTSNETQGIYTASEIHRDKQEVSKREIEFSRAAIPAVQEHYKSKGIMTPEAIVEHWKHERIRQKSGQTEMAVTALLHKILKEEFLVVRASAYDDYMHGVDNLILNKHTGEVICAFDEVHEDSTITNRDRKDKKEEKIEKIAKKGGVKARYGLSLSEGTLSRSKMENTPVFYLSLKTDELKQLLSEMNFDSDGNLAEVEYEIFGTLVASLREQRSRLLKIDSLPQTIQKKLEQFGNTLDVLEKYTHKS